MAVRGVAVSGPIRPAPDAHGRTTDRRSARGRGQIARRTGFAEMDLSRWRIGGDGRDRRLHRGCLVRGGHASRGRPDRADHVHGHRGDRWSDGWFGRRARHRPARPADCSATPCFADSGNTAMAMLSAQPAAHGGVRHDRKEDPLAVHRRVAAGTADRAVCRLLGRDAGGRLGQLELLREMVSEAKAILSRRGGDGCPARIAPADASGSDGRTGLPSEPQASAREEPRGSPAQSLRSAATPAASPA